MALSLVLSGCQARPGDAPTVEEPAKPKAKELNEGKHEDTPDSKLREINIGVDEFDGNLNPHIVGNLGQSTMAVADLTLPSAFNRVGNRWVMNKDLLVKVDANNPVAPTEVTYTLRPHAQWSDGTPISGSDFQYLWDELRTQRIAETAAQYSKISGIKVSGGGSKVRVSFSEPQEGWRQLFRHLLPSHIYRAEGQQFATMMDERSVASGGAYRVHAVDAGRGVIELQRNDRYWGSAPAATDKLILRAVPDVHTGAQMLRSRQLQMYAAYPAGLSALTLGEVPDVRGTQRDRKVQLNFALNLDSERMNQMAVRRAALAAIKPGTVAQIVSGNRDVAPPEWGERPTEQMPDEARALFEERPFTIAAPNNDKQAAIAARTIADELSRNGINAQALTVDAENLLETMIPEGEVDASVLWGRTPDTPTDVANQFSCVQPETLRQAEERAAEDKTSGEDSKSEESTVSSATSEKATESAKASSPQEPRGTETTPSTESAEGSPQRTFGANITGLCDPAIDEAIAEVRDGEDSAAAIEQVNALVQNQSVLLPLLRDEQYYAASPEFVGSDKPVEQWPFDPYSGIFVGGARWTRQDVAEPTTAAPEPEVPSSDD
ncbi:MAG TPA: ABC transporter family substrate-binding protein [Candidatus Corynebacterium intestinavium]|uniref:ABC transporter family substrate-binding protein n=1 Tax=Candidatus Corynebacterium intestinavium TaxID=2838531 RepID=A0A9D2UAL1_9CORY|nr:ABC transporter family substrate-binding protein [Candidatus Corynebacterium intestinavium]